MGEETNELAKMRKRLDEIEGAVKQYVPPSPLGEIDELIEKATDIDENGTEDCTYYATFATAKLLREIFILLKNKQ
jgi:hypothetical protein